MQNESASDEFLISCVSTIPPPGPVREGQASVTHGHVFE